jgi:hypothetical protein
VKREKGTEKEEILVHSKTSEEDSYIYDDFSGKLVVE